MKRTEHENDKLSNHTTMVYLPKKNVNFCGKCRQIYHCIECLAIGSLWIRHNPWLEQGQDTAKAGDILYKEDWEESRI